MTTSIVMRGPLERFGMNALLDVVSLSRQPMTLQFEGDAPGVLHVKSGQVTSASGPNGPGVPAAVALLKNASGEFALRKDPTPALGVPIASLAPLRSISALSSASERAPVVLSSSRGGASLPDVLQTLGLSRQLLALRMFAGNTLIGELYVKAGKVLRAWTADGLDEPGLSAFGSLQPSAFSVHRLTQNLSDAPLSDLATLSALAAPKPRPVLMAGALADTPLESTLSVVALSRQRLAIELLKDDTVVGEVVVQGGRIVAPEPDTTPAFHALQRSGATHFRVSRIVNGGAVSDRGALSDWLATPPPARCVLATDLGRDGVPEILGVLQLSRQWQRVELHGSEQTGTLIIKAGAILDATLGSHTGQAALDALAVHEVHRLEVFTTAPTSATPLTTLAAFAESWSAADSEATVLFSMPDPPVVSEPEAPVAAVTQPAAPARLERPQAPANTDALEARLAKLESQANELERLSALTSRLESLAAPPPPAAAAPPPPSIWTSPLLWIVLGIQVLWAVALIAILALGN